MTEPLFPGLAARAATNSAPAGPARHPLPSGRPRASAPTATAAAAAPVPAASAGAGARKGKKSAAVPAGRVSKTKGKCTYLPLPFTFRLIVWS
ncbi:hypothetical protein MCOR25_003582 [Pyricularia grisea]|nr:hypothetical protein MCOR25_003582 [Pyricularia grisea]